MKREDILKIAQHVGLIPDTSHPTADTRYMRNKRNALSIFGALVAKAEREECAKVCDRIEADGSIQGYACECADAIRTRGKE